MSGLIQIFGLGPDDAILFAECDKDTTEEQAQSLAIPEEDILFSCDGRDILEKVVTEQWWAYKETWFSRVRFVENEGRVDIKVHDMDKKYILRIRNPTDSVPFQLLIDPHMLETFPLGILIPRQFSMEGNAI